jgi:Putative prokaryotic signal transducing protein
MGSPEDCCVFSTGSAGVAAVAKSLLEAERIKYFVRNEGLYGSLTSFNFATGPIEFWVRADDEVSARELLQDLAETD